MHLDAAVSDSHRAAFFDLADELGLSREQLVDHAMAFFVKAVSWARQGRPPEPLDLSTLVPADDIPDETQGIPDWARNPQRLVLSPQEFEKMCELIESPPPLNGYMRAALERWG